jgi:glycosyltransferase involved in cell wall biosynthesis
MSGTALHGVLVTYRRPADLENMLVRLAEQARQLDSLVVIDNDPGESARDVVAAYGAGRGGVSYVAAGANTGPAGGIATGMEFVLNHAADDDWIVLLDDDDPPRTCDMLGMLEEFGTRLRKNDASVGGVGKSGTDFNVALARAQRVPDEMLVGAVPTDCVAGNQLPFYSVHAVRRTGVFDRALFFGFEELEYGLRLRSAGFQLFAHGQLWRRDREHHGRLGMRTPPDVRVSAATWRRYYSLRNMIYILRRGGHGLPALRLAVRNVAKPIVNLPLSPRLALSNLGLNLAAIRDAYLGRMGRTVSPVAKD